MKEKKEETRIEIAPVSPRTKSLDESKFETSSTSHNVENQGKAEPKPGFSNFIRVLKFGDNLDYALMISSAASAIGSGIAVPLMFLVFGRMVGDLTSYFTPFSAMTQAQFMKKIEQNALYLVYLGIARFVLSYIAMLSVRISGVRISARLRIAYLSAIFKQSISVVDKISPGTIASRLTTNSNTIESGISQQLCLAIQATAFTVGLYVVAFIKNALLTLVATASVPVVLIAYAIAVPFMNKVWYESEAIKDKASSLAYEIFQSIRIVTAFGVEDRMSERHAKIVEKSRKVDRKLAPIMGALMAPMLTAVYGIFGLTFWFGVSQYAKGRINNIGTIIVYVVVLFSVLWAVMSIYHLYNPIMQMTRAASAATEMFAVIDATLPDESGVKDDCVSISTDDIVFQNVAFAYPARPETAVLSNLSVRFENRKTTAIVGPSGSGKSTIVALLEKWYKPSKPSTSSIESPQDENLIEKFESPTFNSSSGIFIGNINLDTIDSKWWRSNIGLVQQEPFLFNDTIYQNVANGLAGTHWQKETEEVKRYLVKTACKEANADGFISKLPLGYDTLVGEGGMKMSGGQRQRIAIARAIVKNPLILILDEATSAIDVRTERIVQKALDRVSKTRTTIIIAHRLSTIKTADKIVVIRNGEVIEQGTHQELLRNENGAYTGLVRAQEVETGSEEVDDNMTEDPVNITEEVELHKRKIEEEVITEQRGFLRSLGRLLVEQNSKWPLYVLVVVGAIIGASAYPVQAYLFAHVIDVFTILVKSELLRKGTFWALMFIVLAVGVGFGFLIIGWSAAIVASDVASIYRQEYLYNILKKKIPFFDKEENSAGTLTSRISTDASQLMQLLGGEMALQMVGILGLIGSIIISFYYGWKLTLVGLFSIMPLIMGAGYYRVRLEKDYERLNAAVFAETAQFGAEAISGFRTVKALIMEDAIMSRFDNLLKDHIKKAIQNTRISTLVFSFSESAEMFCQALFFWYGGKLLSTREYDVIHFFVVYMGIMQSSTSLGMWFSLSPNLAEATAAANRILGSRPSETEEKKRKMDSTDRPAKIEFSNVQFSYEGRDVPVLHNMNLTIEPGQFAAFVGASGSGKSTMISLLERFYEPIHGKILFDGVDISSVDEPSYREQISLVAQESTLFDGTITENVALSLPPNSPPPSPADIQSACEAAQIHNFITSLPQGYETPLGNRGMALSGGQRQRLALARALLRKPKLLLLDEATSNLDSESERLVQEAIEKAATEGGNGHRKRTVIAVAHRLATIQRADVIFVIGSGRILEKGNHAELLTKRGIYWQMCQAQALDR